MEIWKEVVGYDGRYQVSNYGKVRSLNFKRNECVDLLSPIKNNGYFRMTLYKNGAIERYLLHRLVANAFIPNPLNKPCVNHIDGNGQNNRVENLEWVSYGENNKHAYDTGLRKKCFGKDNVQSKPVICYSTTNNFIGSFESIGLAVIWLRLNNSPKAQNGNISMVCKGKRETAYGYKWRYENG